MLNLMRKHAGSWLIKVILAAIVVVFVFWGVGSFRDREATEVADVNGEIISHDEYRQAYYRTVEQYRRIYGSQFNDDMLKMLQPSEQALNQLIDRTLLLQEAARLNIRVTDHELTNAIRQIPVFQKDGAFDYKIYQRVLALNHLTMEEFEVSHKHDLRINKLRTLITGGVNVSEDEAREWYNWDNTEIDLTYVLFDPQRYKDIKATDEEIKSYFEEHQNNYQTEPQVKVRYLFVDPAKYKSQVKIDEDAVSEYYESHPEEFRTEKTVEARHILLKLDSGADAQTGEDKRNQARKIYDMAVAGQDFAELAKKYSEGPSRDKGGYLGAFKKESMVKPFADKAFSMEAGEISEPVRTRFGWHVIKVEKINEAVTQSLEKVSSRIRDDLTDEKARDIARERIEEIYDSVFDGDDLIAVGQSFDMPVKETDFFTSNGPQQKETGNPRQFADTAFKLEKMAVSEVQDFGNGYYLLQVIDRIEAKIPEFETVADRVEKDLIKSRQDEKAKADAETFLVDLKKDSQVSELGSRYKVKPMQTGFFKRTGSIPKIGYEPAISQAGFGLSKKKPYPEEVYKGRQGYYAIILNDRKLPPADGFAKEKESIVQRLASQKKQRAFQDWIADVKSRSTISVNRELIQ